MASNRKKSSASKGRAASARKSEKPSKKSAGKPLAVQPAPVKASRVPPGDAAAPDRREAFNQDLTQEPAREMFETLGRLQEELATAAQAMTGTDDHSAATQQSQFAALLASQKQMLEQVKTSVTEFQALIDSCEEQLAAEAAATAERAKQGGNATGIDVPVQALESFQKMALSNIGMWTKAAQDTQSVWLSAVQAWMPVAGVLRPFAGEAGEADDDEAAAEKGSKRQR